MLIDDMLDLPGIALCKGGNLVNLYADEIACVVRADNVAALAAADTRPMDELPCLRPPFEYLWIEWAQDNTRSGCFWHQFTAGPPIGCFLGAYSWPRGGSLQDEGHRWIWLQDDGTYRSAFSLDEERAVVAASLRPDIRARLGEDLPQSGTLQDFARDCGVEAADLEEADRVSWSLRHPLTDKGQEILRTAALAVCLMHCKNVTAAPVDPSPTLQKARQKRGKRPLFRYHVLSIESMRQVLRKAGGLGTGPTGIAQALHICRGHFKDYRQSGLFGKVKGIFWWDQHARGDAQHGVVAKDYEVK